MDYTWTVNIDLQGYPDGCRRADVELIAGEQTWRTSVKLPLHKTFAQSIQSLGARLVWMFDEENLEPLDETTISAGGF